MPRRGPPFALLALLACAPAPAAAMDWTYATVDSTRYSGNSLAMQLNAQGAKRYAWWTAAVGVVFAGDGLPAEVLPAVYDEPRAAPADGGRDAGPAGAQLLITYSVDLALSAAGEPWAVQVRHDCFRTCTGTARVQRRTPSGWVTENLGTAYSRAAIAVDAGGRVHVAYASGAYVIEYWVRESGGGWSGGPTGLAAYGGLSLRLGADGTPHLAWPHGGALRYAVRANGAWQAQVVDSGGVVSASLALAPGGARIAYDANGPGLAAGLWYAEQGPGGWTRTFVAGSPPTAGGAALALDPAGDPFLAFNDQAGLDLRFASRKAGAWTVGDVDTYGNTGYYPAVAFDPSGRPLVAYQADAGVGIRLATGTAIVGVPPAPPAAARLAVRALGPARAGEPLVLEVRAAEPTTVTLTLVDVAGRALARLADRPVAAGANKVRWNAGARAPGVYFVRARDAGGSSAGATLVLTR